MHIQKSDQINPSELILASLVIADSSHRFVTDAEKTQWNLPSVKGFSEADVYNLYVNAVSGLDTASGLKIAPLRTIKEALSRGPKNIRRIVWLYESQEHLVDPANPAILREGTCNFIPYGPSVDALPLITSGSTYTSQAGIDLNTRIKALDYILLDAGNGQKYQEGGALYGSGYTKMFFAGLTLIPGNRNTEINPGTSLQWPVYGNAKSFSKWGETVGSCSFWWSKLKTTAVDQSFFGSSDFPFDVILHEGNILEGPGNIVHRTPLTRIQYDPAVMTNIKNYIQEYGKSFTSNGYEVLPSGLIFQWGRINIPASLGITFNFPIAFPNSCFSFVVSKENNNENEIVFGNAISLSQASVDNNPGNFISPSQWIAIGF